MPLPNHKANATHFRHLTALSEDAPLAALAPSCAAVNGSAHHAAQVNRKLAEDQLDLADRAGQLCELLGEVAALPHFTPSSGSQVRCGGKEEIVQPGQTEAESQRPSQISY